MQLEYEGGMNFMTTLAHEEDKSASYSALVFATVGSPVESARPDCVPSTGTRAPLELSRAPASSAGDANR